MKIMRDYNNKVTKQVLKQSNSKNNGNFYCYLVIKIKNLEKK